MIHLGVPELHRGRYRAAVRGFYRAVGLKAGPAVADGWLVVPAAATLWIRSDIVRPAPDEVVEWRFDELERAGVEAVEALRLALDPSFEIAGLRSLVARGCPAGLALRILR